MKEKYLAPDLDVEILLINAIIAASPTMNDLFTTGTDYTWNGTEYEE